MCVIFLSCAACIACSFGAFCLFYLFIIFCILQKDVSCILIFIKFSRNILMWFSLKKMLRAIFIFVIFVHGVVFIVVCTFMILIVLLCAITFCCHLNLHESFCCSPKTVSAHAVKTMWGFVEATMGLHASPTYYFKFSITFHYIPFCLWKMRALRSNWYCILC